MKQLTSEARAMGMSAGFVFAPRRPEGRRRLLNSLRPPAALPLDLREWEIIAELDPGVVDWPGMVDWDKAQST